MSRAGAKAEEIMFKKHGYQLILAPSLAGKVGFRKECYFFLLLRICLHCMSRTFSLGMKSRWRARADAKAEEIMFKKHGY